MFKVTLFVALCVFALCESKPQEGVHQRVARQMPDMASMPGQMAGTATNMAGAGMDMMKKMMGGGMPGMPPMQVPGMNMPGMSGR